MVYPDGHGYFPDSISSRASRHVTELEALVKEGSKCAELTAEAKSKQNPQKKTKKTAWKGNDLRYCDLCGPKRRPRGLRTTFRTS